MKRYTGEQLVLYGLLRGEELKLPPDFDPEYFFRLLRRHKLVPLAERLLPHLSGATYEEWRLRLTIWAARSLLLMNRLKELNMLLSRADIRFISLKGPLLSFQLYGDYQSRYYSDLDIFVGTDDFNRALSLLLENGYILKAPKGLHSDEEWNNYFRGANDVKLYHPDSRILVELHLGIYVSRLLKKDDGSGMLNSTVALKVGNETYSVPDPGSNFIYLCFHAAKHMFFRLSWLRDISDLMQGSEIDHEEVYNRASGLRIGDALILSVGLVERYFGLEVPEIYRPGLAKAYYRRRIRMAMLLIDGPYNSVNRGGSPDEQKRNPEKGINSGILFSNLVSALFLVSLRKGISNRFAYLYYQFAKRVIKRRKKTA